MRQPKLCFHKTTGRYFVRLNGQQVYLGQQKREARAAYDRLIGEWLVRGRKPLIGDLGLTVCEMLERYRQYAESYYVLPNGEPSSELNWIASSCRVLRKRYGEQPAASIGPLALESLREAFIAAGYCRTSVNARIDRIRRVFRWAVAKQLVPPSVYEALRALPGLRKGRSQAKESEPIGPVADIVVDATLPLLPTVVADMVRLQRLTGARPNEICSMRVGEVDRTDAVWQYRPGHHKTEHHGRARVILIGPKAQAILAPYLLNSAEAFVFSPVESERRRRLAANAARQTPAGYGNTVGTNRKRCPKRPPKAHYSTESYRRAIHRACDRTNQRMIAEAVDAGRGMPPGQRLFSRWSPNRVRHTAATELRSRFGIEAAQLVLGHSDPRTSLIYAERDLATAARFVAQVG